MADIPTAVLGRTGFAATKLGYGTVGLLGLERRHAGALLEAVLDAGINLLDTSPDTSPSEELIGEFVADRRDEFFLASKCGCVPGKNAIHDHDYTPDNIRAGVEQSLRRTKTEYLDLVQVHLSPSRQTLEADGTIETLRALQAEGKVRFLGMSGTIPHLADHIDMGVFDVFQIPYSGIEPEHADLITRAAAAGAGVIVRGAVNRGVNADTTVPDRLRAVEATMRERHIWNVEADERRSRVEQAGFDDLLGEQTNVTEFMLRFTLSNPDVHTAIVGTSSAQHLQANVDATKQGALPPAAYAAAKSRLDFS